MRRAGGFTLVEIAIAVFIMLLLLLVAIPSLSGVMADRRLRRSLNDMNSLVRQAQERSATERRAYLIVWDKERLLLRPEELRKGDPKTSTVLKMRRGDALQLELPAALQKENPGQWIFWPSGNCELAVVKFRGPDGSWSAKYSPLTARAELTYYAAK